VIEIVVFRNAKDKAAINFRWELPNMKSGNKSSMRNVPIVSTLWNQNGILCIFKLTGDGIGCVK
jgi:hypothetical protein